MINMNGKARQFPIGPQEKTILVLQTLTLDQPGGTFAGVLRHRLHSAAGETCSANKRSTERDPSSILLS
jgi:hypothetical protein